MSTVAIALDGKIIQVEQDITKVIPSLTVRNYAGDEGNYYDPSDGNDPRNAGRGGVTGTILEFLKYYAQPRKSGPSNHSRNASNIANSCWDGLEAHCSIVVLSHWHHSSSCCRSDAGSLCRIS